MTKTLTSPSRRTETVRRPTNVGRTAARNLIVRALRHAGLHHALREQPCIVSLVVPHPQDRPDFVAAAKAMLRTLSNDALAYEFARFDDAHEVVEFDGKPKRPKAAEDTMRETLASHVRVFAIAGDPADLPTVFRTAADAIVTPDPVDARVLAGADLTDAAERLEGASGAVIEQVVRDARRRARTERRDLAPGDIGAALPKRIQLSNDDFRRACIHEAGHAVIGTLLSLASGKVPTQARVFREVSADGAAGVTAYHRVGGVMRTRLAHLAEIVGFLAGLAAEELVLGAHTEGAGGSERSDLHQATVLAAAMEVSLGFGGNLAYLAPADDAELLKRLRSNPSLRRAVNRTLAKSRERARTMLEANRPALDALALLLEDAAPPPARRCSRSFSKERRAWGRTRHRDTGPCPFPTGSPAPSGPLDGRPGNLSRDARKCPRPSGHLTFEF